MIRQYRYRLSRWKRYRKDDPRMDSPSMMMNSPSMMMNSPRLETMRYRKDLGAEAGLRSSVHFRTDWYVPYPAC
jgi:hypothetical protein